jgi:di/tricarboxylate transporter
MTKNKIFGLVLAVVVGLIILMMPTPEGLLTHTPTGVNNIPQRVLAIIAFTVVLWVFSVVNNGIASVLMMGLLIAAKVPPPDALYGFSQGSWWTLVAVLYYGCAMKSTGLAQRISYYVLSLFPATYTGILFAFFVIGSILSLGIPSMTVRTAIMVPIAWALVQSLGIPPKSKGSALIILTTVEMAVVPGVGTLMGSLNGPVIISVFNQMKLPPITFSDYTRVMALPTLVICVLIIVLNQIMLRPESPIKVGGGFAKQELKKLGPIKQNELITGLVVLASIFMWATQGPNNWHNIPAFVIGMIALGIFGFTGIIKDSDIATGVSWTLLLFLGGVFSLAQVVDKQNIFKWVGGYFIPVASQMISTPMLLIATMVVAVLILRFVDPTGFLVIPVLFLPIVEIMMKAGISPLVVVAPTTVASAPFWLPYENFWIAMSESLTGGQGYTGGQRVRLATVYAVTVLVTLTVSVVFWKMTGAIQ